MKLKSLVCSLSICMCKYRKNGSNLRKTNLKDSIITMCLIFNGLGTCYLDSVRYSIDCLSDRIQSSFINDVMANSSIFRYFISND